MSWNKKIMILGILVLTMIFTQCTQLTDKDDEDSDDETQSEFTVSVNINNSSDFDGAVFKFESKLDNKLITINPTSENTVSIVISGGTLSVKVLAYVNDVLVGTGEGKLAISSGGLVLNITLTKVEDYEVSAPVITPLSGTYNITEFTGFTLVTDTVGADIYYTLDGTVPDAASIKYSGNAVTFAAVGTYSVKAIAVKGSFKSDVAERAYVITSENVVSPVQFSIPAGRYKLSEFDGVALSSATADVVIRYTLDGSTPTETSQVYSGVIDFTATGTFTLKTRGFKSGYTSSSVSTAVYEMYEMGIAPAPQVTPASGTYESGSFPGLECSDLSGLGGVIRYTMDGTEPSESSVTYTSKITVGTGAHTFKFKYFVSGYMPSATVTREYVITPQLIVEMPVITASGSSPYTTSTKFSITTATSGAEIRYTTDGTTPTAASSLYSGTFSLTVGTHIVKAIGIKSGYKTSDPASSTFTITNVYDGVVIYYKASSAPSIWVWSEEGLGMSNPAVTGNMKDANGTKYTWTNQPVMVAAAGYAGWCKFEIPASAIPSTMTKLAMKFNSGSEQTRNPGKTGWFDPSTSTWTDVCPDKLSVTADPGTSAFTSKATVTIKALGNGIIASRYTIDGSDPKVAGTTFTAAGQVITFGSSAAVGDKIYLKLYAATAADEVSSTFTYTKDVVVTVNTLGATYSSASTTFRIWSPDNSNVVVNVAGTDYQCSKVADFNGYTNIYGVTVSGDLKLKEYQFKIGGVAVRDPYGRMVKNESGVKKTYTEESASVTSDCGSNTNIIVDLDATEPDGGWVDSPALVNREDSIIYEVHVGDFTSDSDSGVTISKRGKFLGMVETGTKYSSLATGIDHLKELGVTHVQLMPIYDYATKYNSSTGESYNWGYDPVNFNVPEERFAADPNDYAGRVKELKTMINEFHKNGIRVVMDVVYNHTFWDEMFGNITTKYYDGLNLSGCGNSVDSGNTMVSRFIRDSMEYWIDEYHVDGFRFDLVGIFYTDVVKGWGEYLNNKYSNKNLLLYGEPWKGGGTDPNESSKVRMSNIANAVSGHIGIFNGRFRENIKGGNDDTQMAYIFNNNYWNYGVNFGAAGNIEVGLKGALGGASSDMWNQAFAADPEQSINYISAHDNLCLYDKILECGKTGDYAKRILKFGDGIVMVSQGIPFIHAGDEFLRTKKVGTFASRAHNSYMWGQTMNKVYWSLKSANNSVFKYHKDLIALRKANPGLRFTTASEINSYVSTSSSGNVITLQTDNNKDGTKDLYIVINPGNNVNASLPSGSWSKIFDINGSVSSTDVVCEGTAVTVFKRN